MQDQFGDEIEERPDRDIPDPAEGMEFAPLPTDWQERASEISDQFLSDRSVTESERLSLERFVFTSLKFAYLEKRIQSEIICDIPTSLGTIDESTSLTLLEEAELLAKTERINLEIPDGPVEYLAEILDDRGIKVFEWPHPTGDFAGGFLFAKETGPALLVLGPKESPLSQFSLAHQYCHLLADNNPYENRFCTLCTSPVKDILALGGRMLEQSDFENPFDEISLAESRADLFARCFLLPAEHFQKTLHDFSETGDPYDLERLSNIAFYYGVTTPLVINRLVDLELLPLDKAKGLSEQIRSAMLRNDNEAGLLAESPKPTNKPEPDDDDRLETLFSRLPKRNITLAIALLMKGQISKEQVGYLLDIGAPLLDTFLAWTEEPAGTLRASAETDKGGQSETPGDWLGRLRHRN